MHKNKFQEEAKPKFKFIVLIYSICVHAPPNKFIFLQKNDRINIYMQSLLHLCFSIVIKSNCNKYSFFFEYHLVSAKFFTLIPPTKTTTRAIFVGIILNLIWILSWGWSIYSLIVTIPRFLSFVRITRFGSKRNRCMSFLSSFLL